ncbi:glycerate kinase [Egicoccus sp. AB-alg6-2]|uniref:glycerate kinase n=1 Tax=Egicoccus sp. AB-alg6-2 TaxID=3242692 RepID=UPI00359CDDBD
MRVLICPDSFKGTLTAAQAAEAIAAGWGSARPEDVLESCPLSDGGDGLLEVVAASGEWRHERGRAEDPLRRPVEVAWLRRGNTVVVESAAACGLHLVDEAERDPAGASTFGVGQLLRLARQGGVEAVHVGLGGSATVDGGIGMLAALGADLVDADGAPVGAAGAPDLARIARAAPGRARDWFDLDLVVVSDVTTTLPDAAAVFGPQKGATPQDVVRLTAGLTRFADAVEAGFDRPGLRQQPGTGAAGGLGFALAALGARVVDGADHVAAMVGLEEAVAAADLVVVGEGQLDATSLQGKVIGGVLARAVRHGVPVAAVVGRVAERSDGLVDVAEASPDGPGVDPVADVRAAARRLASGIRLDARSAGR